MELRKLSNILVNIKKNQDKQRNLLLIDGIIKSTVFEENLALSIAFIEFIILNSQTYGIFTTKEIELIHNLHIISNINFLKFIKNYELVNFNLNDGNKNEYSNMLLLLEKFLAPSGLIGIFKKKTNQRKEMNIELPKENKYLFRLKDCFKEIFILDVSNLKNEEKIKRKGDIIKKYFKGEKEKTV